MLIQATRLGKYYGARALLDDVNFVISPGDKVGLVGPNGSGKTTLLQMILGELEPDSGELAIAGKPNIGYLQQDTIPPAGVTLYRFVLSELDEFEQRLETEYRDLAANPEDKVARQQCDEIQDQLATRFGPDYRSRVEQTLTEFGFLPDRYDVLVSNLSPGERSRLELTRILIQPVDFLVLDEPTNFLDIAQRESLEDLLVHFSGTVLAVSHDRVFLNRVADRIFDLRRGRLTVYEGSFDFYSEVRQRQRLKLIHDHEVQTREIRKLQQMSRCYKVWSGRSEKVKSKTALRAKGVIDRGYASHIAAKLAKRAKHAEKRLEQQTEQLRAEMPFVEKKPKPRLPEHSVPRKRAVAAAGITKSFGEYCVLHDLTFEIQTGERVALIGPNGCGKSVLLRILLGELNPDLGESALGAGIKIGYFPQDVSRLNLNRTALATVMESGMTQESARTVLGTLLLPKEFAERRLTDLSAGERSKVLLAQILAGGADFLILDEPTNHLDLDTLEALEEMLHNFPGGLLFASHDRAFLSLFAERVLELKGARLTDYPGDYLSFREGCTREPE